MGRWVYTAEGSYFDPDLPGLSEQAANRLPGQRDWPQTVEPAGPGELRIAFRCSADAYAWAAGLADHINLDFSSLIWQGLIRLAENSGYTARVPVRYQPKRGRRRRPRRPRRPGFSGDGSPPMLTP
jgi:hypothetical protein